MKIKIFKDTFLELIGSLGDLGTFIPIACGLIIINKVSGASLFLAAGLLYITAGVYFKIPMPVQPLKATSALAIAIGASASTIAFVCFFMAAALFGITFFNLDRLIARLFTRPIIRGIQLGLAFILIKSGFALVLGGSSGSSSLSADSLNIYQAFFLLFLPQLPLTLANSIYATCDTAQIYFKDKANKVTPKALFMSLGIANLVSGCIGGIPLCHGSGGLTAHYRLGARKGLCGVCIGSAFLLTALAFSLGAGIAIRAIPFWLLGISLIYIGIRHGALIGDIIRFPRECSVAVIIGLFSLIFNNLAAAFSIGIAVNFLLENSLSLRERMT